MSTHLAPWIVLAISGPLNVLALLRLASWALQAPHHPNHIEEQR